MNSQRADRREHQQRPAGQRRAAEAPLRETAAHASTVGTNRKRMNAYCDRFAYGHEPLLNVGHAETPKNVS